MIASLMNLENFRNLRVRANRFIYYNYRCQSYDGLERSEEQTTAFLQPRYLVAGEEERISWRLRAAAQVTIQEAQ
jgi:hypothetical protein